MRTKNPAGNNLRWQLAATDPNMGDYPTASIIVQRQPLIGERGRMPAVESRPAWSKSHNDRDFTIGVSGRYDRGKNETTVLSNTAFAPVDSWGVALDYSLPFSKLFNVTGSSMMGGPWEFTLLRMERRSVPLEQRAAMACSAGAVGRRRSSTSRSNGS